MSYQMIHAIKRIAADKPDVFMTLSELRAQEARERADKTQRERVVWESSKY